MATCLKANNINPGELNILFVAYKAELELELYAKKNSENTYRKIQTYYVCERSGNLGPKRKQGDLQVPEGFYHIDRFNPISNFYLSLGINYPNQSDRKKGTANNLGGDIFIHGACVTVGCLPMTDDKIKEIYLYAVQAKHNGQNQIPVYIFPFRMTNQNVSLYTESYSNEEELLSFWKNLKPGYDKFETTKQELT
ncbi:MAG: L,D-transpeptidase family protein, partial [Hymenobacteraceae bacterium]|nr:L,D-transpeptidase family protein [Hymenobacteraceae bacterium]MDX5395467.1 L,D-transpeptidase family protein [Hymenobacteraceae bacterium]MDX5511519.1 L,D-transpeptidase family protein [Hymenobacteraceae bacterium]